MQVNRRKKNKSLDFGKLKIGKGSNLRDSDEGNRLTSIRIKALNK